MNKKDSHESDCLESEIQMTAGFLNSTPCKLQKPLAFGRYAPILCLWHKAHGATLLASLMSELIASASLRYLRLGRGATPAQEGANLSCSKGQKKTATNVTVFFWRSRRDLNSRAGIADLHP